MSKKSRIGKKTYTSKGERPNVNQKTRNDMRNAYTGTVAEMAAKVEAWRKGKNVVLTIPNPNTEETNRPLIRGNSWDVWGSPFPPKKKDK